MDVVELGPSGVSHCFDVCREQQGVVQGHAKVLCTLEGGHRGVLNRAGEAGLPGEEEQLGLVEVELAEVADTQVEIAARHAGHHLGVRKGEREK